MKDFFGEQVLLNNAAGERLYKDYAKSLPIIDYHCHLSPAEILQDKPYDNIGELWLGGDHYKWRAMRQNGIPEELVTGNAAWKDKFMAYASTLPHAIGNPLYYWSHMELGQLFGIHTPLSAESAEHIWAEANERMAQGDFTARSLMKRCGVEALCTTDDPADELQYHKKLAADPTFTTKVLPTFRPDIICTGLNRKDFGCYIGRLSVAADTEITGFNELLTVLEQRMEVFAQAGCKVADHGMTSLPSVRGTLEDAQAAFTLALQGKEVPQAALEKYSDYMLRFFAGRYNQRNWVMQLHMAPLRNVSTKMFRQVGADAGFDVIGEPISAAVLARILDDISLEAGLPKMIFYSLNPSVNDLLGAMTGGFSGDVAGKIQLGSAWWFNDHLDGIRLQLRTLAACGLLGRFVGMLTDSRSFTSYVRFDFFRRILCSEVGDWIEKGEYTAEAGALVTDICYRNAKNYFTL